MGFNTLDDVVSKLPGQQQLMFKAGSLTVGSPGLYRDMWLDQGTFVGTLTDVLSANQGGTWYTASHAGAWRFSNPNSTANESCCIGRAQVWGKVPSDTHLLYDRVWACRGIHANTTALFSVASLAFVRSFDATKAELWAWVAAPLGATAHNLTINYIDASDVARTVTVVRPFAGSMYLSISNKLQGIPFNSQGIKRVTSGALTAATGAAGDYGLAIRIPLLVSPLGYGLGTQDALGTGLTTVSSDVCFEQIFNSSTVQFDQVGFILNLITK